MSFAFWFTTSTGSVKIVPAARAPARPPRPPSRTSLTIFSVGRCVVGTWHWPRRRVDRLLAVRRDVLGPLGAVPVAQLVAADRVGVPVRRGRRSAAAPIAGGVRSLARCQRQITKRSAQVVRAARGSRCGCGRPGSPRGPARRRTSARPTVARLRSSHAGGLVALDLGRRRRPLARRSSDSAERSTPAWASSCAAARRGSVEPSGRRWPGQRERSATDVTAAQRRDRIAPVGRGPSTPRSIASTTRGPNTMPSSSELDASRLAPCTPLQPPRPPPTARAATTAPSRSATTPPQL